MFSLRNRVKNLHCRGLTLRVSGAALFYAIMIALILGIVCSTVVTMTFSHRMEGEMIGEQSRLLSNLQSATDRQKALGESSPDGWSDLFGNGTDSVWAQTSLWGLYRVTYIKAVRNRFWEEKTIVYGSSTEESEKVSLWMADHGDPLAVCGQVEIKGPAYLPEAVIRKTYIEGKTFTGSLPQSDELKKSGRNIPALSSVLLDHLKNNLLGRWETDSVIALDPERKRYERGFDKPPLVVLIEADSLALEGYSFVGHVVVVGRKSLFLKKNTICLDGIVVAPRIYVDKGFRGRIQCVVSEKFESFSGAIFDYPSSIVCYTDDKEKGSIVLGEENWLGGGVVFWAEEREKGLLTVGKNSIVYGMVYASDNLENRGTICGTTYCNEMILKTPSAVYSNHLLDATFDVTKMPEKFVNPILFDDDSWDEALEY